MSLNPKRANQTTPSLTVRRRYSWWDSHRISRPVVQLFFIFTPTWGTGEDEPNLTSIFFKWVETTNYISYMSYFDESHVTRRRCWIVLDNVGMRLTPNARRPLFRETIPEDPHLEWPKLVAHHVTQHVTTQKWFVLERRSQRISGPSFWMTYPIKNRPFESFWNPEDRSWRCQERPKARELKQPVVLEVFEATETSDECESFSDDQGCRWHTCVCMILVARFEWINDDRI